MQVLGCKLLGCVQGETVSLFAMCLAHCPGCVCVYGVTERLFLTELFCSLYTFLHRGFSVLLGEFMFNGGRSTLISNNRIKAF